jgi:hypothetical protein
MVECKRISLQEREDFFGMRKCGKVSLQGPEDFSSIGECEKWWENVPVLKAGFCNLDNAVSDRKLK